MAHQRNPDPGTAQATKAAAEQKPDSLLLGASLNRASQQKFPQKNSLCGQSFRVSLGWVN